MSKSTLGVISLFAAAALYGSYGVLSRLIGNTFGNFNQDWVRNLIVVVLITVIILITRSKITKLKKPDLPWIFLWFITGSWATVFSFIAFNHLPIGTAYLIIYAAMITAGFVSGRIFFAEKMNVLKIVSLALALIGLLIIYRFTLEPGQIIFLLLCLLSGLMTGTWNTISKKFSDHYANNQLVFMDALNIVLAAYVGALLFREPWPSSIPHLSWLWMGLFAVIQIINVGLVVYGFKHLEAQIGSIILPVEIIFATIFSALIFGEYPTLLTILGGSLILSAAILPSVQLLTTSEKNVQ